MKIFSSRGNGSRSGHGCDDMVVVVTMMMKRNKNLDDELE